MSIIGHFRMVVPAAIAKPSPKLGQAMGPLGINMMSFCKEINERTKKVADDVPIQTTLVPRTDRTYKFFVRSPKAAWFLMRAARLPRSSERGAGAAPVGNITYKELFHIAKAKSMDPQMIGTPLRTICLGLLRTASAMGIKVTRELEPEFSKRNDVEVTTLEIRRKEIRLQNKAGKKPGKK